MLQQDTELFFKDIYKKFSPKVHRLCLGYTGNAMLADDLLQETFIKVWQNLDKFQGNSQISTWVYRIAVNTCLYHIRSQKNKVVTSLDQINNVIVEETDCKEQQVQLLYQCISKLVASDRLIITLLLEEVSYTEIAVITEISEGNLRVKIHRIKQQLSKLYTEYERI